MSQLNDKLINYGNLAEFHIKILNDLVTSDKSTWSSEKIQAMIADAGFGVEIVQSLPVSGDAHTIYFVPASPSGETDLYDEYMYVDSAWEKVGSTRLDLSDYYTKSETDTLLDGKADVYKIVTSAEIEDLFLYAQPNEIWYTSYQNRVITPTNTQGLPAIVSNTNVNGKGKIVFASQITSLPEFMFEENPIETIMLPDTITTLGQGSFRNSNLKSFICPKNVTVIPIGIFQDLTTIEYVELPSGITRIDNFAFSVSQYGHLTSITYKGTMAQWNAITKDKYWKHGATKLTVVHCSDGDVNL